jgi:hypothetical protein
MATRNSNDLTSYPKSRGQLLRSFMVVCLTWILKKRGRATLDKYFLLNHHRVNS